MNATTTKPTKLIFWTRGPHDSRDTASGTAEYELIHGSAVSIARHADIYGQSAIDAAVVAGELRPAAHNRPEFRVAGGHGVTVVYGSGRTREVRGY